MIGRPRHRSRVPPSAGRYGTAVLDGSEGNLTPGSEMFRLRYYDPAEAPALEVP
jgi:hypothetical protein